MCMHMVKITSQEFIWILRWSFHGIVKGEDHLTKRSCLQNTANTTVHATFTTTTTSIATTCRAKSIEMKIFRTI